MQRGRAGIAAALWSAAFIAMWSRQSAVLRFSRLDARGGSYQWGTYDLEDKERVRAEFHGTLRVSPVTGKEERHFRCAQMRSNAARALTHPATRVRLCSPVHLAALCPPPGVRGVRGPAHTPALPHSLQARQSATVCRGGSLELSLQARQGLRVLQHGCCGV
eukprot:Tamp_32577.p1 GENE.Tamp_32577~~Tamp_32577.p1  ORF type:complete len:162 (-),score=19.08 Tamp_32577:108-593(-)